jgi:hypothetical protein
MHMRGEQIHGLRRENFVIGSPFYDVHSIKRKSYIVHGARSELNSVFGWEKVDRWNPIRTSAIQSRSRPTRFMGFSNHEKGAPRQEISK